ncbi:hypothetical protein SAMN05216410_0405 [Sanguibacter gelidistatuariae]|uniref:Uncharacterized protein n=1 Tax=Sanguibacter gelidistatuariae TaxID=1814289 RepID=A0A1G6GRY4_9MICO|nr:hypothetical protein SAMN05216410_0405 [Sanguibacter gelidistatuariae]
MTTDSTAFLREVLLSFQRALWDEVTPELRGIAIKLLHPLIEARFIYEAVGDFEQEITAEVGTYVLADFLPPVDIRFTAVASPPNEKRELEAGERWVYRRREQEAS